MVRPEGLEPPTGGLEIRCSIQLSYGRTAEPAGAPECITGEEVLQRRSFPRRDDFLFLAGELVDEAQV
jgi:hypothetical protein